MHAIRVNAAISARLRARRHSVFGLTEDGCPAIESIRVDERATHLVFSSAACTAILADERFVPSDLSSPVVALGRAFGIDVTSVEAFFRHVPLVARGIEHGARRTRFLQHHNLMRRRHASFIREAAETACRSLVDSRDSVNADNVACTYVDSILRQIFESERVGAGALFDRLAEVHSSVLDYVHHPRLLGETASRMASLLRAFGLEPGRYPEAEEEPPFILLAYVLMGRDPLIGAVGALLSDLGQAERSGGAPGFRLDEVTARRLFQQVCPVNYIGRTATAACEIEGAQIRPGEQVFLLLPYANGQECRAGRSPGLAFGHGTHLCAGTALSLEIAEAFIGALRDVGSQIDASKIRPGKIVAGVFLRYQANE